MFNKKKVHTRLGKYPSNDMLNNAIIFALTGKINESVSEICWAILKADGELFDHTKQMLYENGFKNFITDEDIDVIKRKVDEIK